MGLNILGIESSCDDTSAAVVRDTCLLSNIIAGQEVHRKYGGVVPEFASRAHQQNIIPVIDRALYEAKIHKKDLNAVAFTKGPGLMGSLLVGISFAKSFAWALGIPMVGVDHLHAHILSHFILEQDKEARTPAFPFLCLIVSGGHTQIMRVESPLNFSLMGKTVDDAAGEAFDKSAKILGLPYPGGVMIDRHAVSGNAAAFHLPKADVPALDFSFSGLKTAFLYLVRDGLKQSPDFISDHLPDLCASVQHAIVDSLVAKLEKAVRKTGIREIAVAGGVSANSALRKALQQKGSEKGWNVYFPPPVFSTDNAAMVAVTGYYLLNEGKFESPDAVPYARSIHS